MNTDLKPELKNITEISSQEIEMPL